MKTCGIYLCSGFLFLSIAQTSYTFKLQKVNNAEEGSMSMTTANDQSTLVLPENNDARQKKDSGLPEWTLFIPGVAPFAIMDVVINERNQDQEKVKILEAENTAKQRKIQEEEERLQENESKNRMFREQQELKMKTLEAENAAKQLLMQIYKEEVELLGEELHQIESDIERRRQRIEQENGKIERENKQLEDLLISKNLL